MELSARTIAGVFVEREICKARCRRLYVALREVPRGNNAARQRIMRRIVEVNRRHRDLIKSLDVYAVDQQIGEAFNPGEPYLTEAVDLLRGVDQ